MRTTAKGPIVRFEVGRYSVIQAEKAYEVYENGIVGATRRASWSYSLPDAFEKACAEAKKRDGAA